MPKYGNCDAESTMNNLKLYNLMLNSPNSQSPPFKNLENRGKKEEDDEEESN